MPGIRLVQLSKTYEVPGSASVCALNSVDLEVEPGEFVVVVGHNGSGKSTLLNVISGAVSFDSGSLTLFQRSGDGNHVVLPGQINHATAALRQNPSDNVVVGLTVAENFALARLRPSFPSLFRRPVVAGTGAAPGLFSLGGANAQVRAGELSGGQKQLLALQLALTRDPKLLLLDEPTASLDRENARQVLEAVQRTWADGAITVILVTHDLSAALSVGTRLIVMADGRIIEDMNTASRARLTLEHLVHLCGFGRY